MHATVHQVTRNYHLTSSQYYYAAMSPNMCITMYRVTPAPF